MTELIELDPSSHKYQTLESHFTNAYRIDPSTTDKVPGVHRIFQINQIQSGLKERYEEYLSCTGNEELLFHGTARNCKVGDPGADAKLCNNCPLCYIMHGGYKLQFAKREGLLGKGLYSARNSSKSVAYSNNVNGAEHSSYKAVMMNFVSLGRILETDRHFKYLQEAPSGYDSVHGVCNTQFGSDELVVYDEDALRPAVLVICDNVEVSTFPDNEDPALLSLSRFIDDPDTSIVDYIGDAISNPHAAELEVIRVGAHVEMAVDTMGESYDEVEEFYDEVKDALQELKGWLDWL
ncbi:hypothetical protein FRB96_004269 [Tulasnella sp. 330]|nr:hypothetical protein FRB96_004269 [Tulasnella sp. 330]